MGNVVDSISTITCVIGFYVKARKDILLTTSVNSCCEKSYFNFDS